MSSLTTEQLKRMEENRRLALERRAAAQKRDQNKAVVPLAANELSCPFSTFSSTSFYPPSKENKTVRAQNTVATGSSTGGPHADAKRFKPSVNAASEIGTNIKAVSGICKVVSRDRFCVIAPYHLQMIELFKTVPSKLYDVNSRNWSFSLQDYDTVMKRLQDLGPSVSISGIPKELRTLFQKADANKIVIDDIDVSKIDPKILEALMPFQLAGVRFCISRNGRALIADDMGLGKTIQALAVAHYYKEDWPLLIVCPSSVRFIWAEAIYTWLPSVPRYHVVVMTTGKDFVQDAKILILSYDLLHKQGTELLKMKFNVVVLDESHSLKNFKTNRSKAAQPFTKAANRVILLSGTPALSRPIELYFQLSLINPSWRFSYHDFGVRYCAGKQRTWGWDFTGSSNMDELNVLLKQCFLIRRLKSEVLAQLPAKFRQKIVLPPESVSTTSSDLKQAEQAMCRAHSTEKQGALLAYFHSTSNAKLKGICDYVMDLVKEERKFLCFAHHHAVLDGICQKLDAGGYRYIKIDGSTDSKLRQELCTRFQDDSKCQVAVLSICAASTGITLTAAQLVVFAELFWNPGILLQAEDRAHRIGQQDSVVVQYLYAKGTADDHLWRLLQSKLSVLNNVGLNKDDLTATSTTTILKDRNQPAITNFMEASSSSWDEDDALFASLDLENFK